MYLPSALPFINLAQSIPVIYQIFTSSSFSVPYIFLFSHLSLLSFALFSTHLLSFTSTFSSLPSTLYPVPSFSCSLPPCLPFFSTLSLSLSPFFLPPLSSILTPSAHSYSSSVPTDHPFQSISIFWNVWFFFTLQYPCSSLHPEPLSSSPHQLILYPPLIFLTPKCSMSPVLSSQCNSRLLASMAINFIHVQKTYIWFYQRSWENNLATVKRFKCLCFEHIHPWLTNG